MRCFIYLLLNELRRIGLAGTCWAGARPATLRNKLLKIGARVRVTTRKIWVALASAHPYEQLFALAYDRLARAGPAPRLRPDRTVRHGGHQAAQRN